MFSGGYDGDFVKPLSDQYTCPICHLAFRQPTLTDCGHQFCEDCVRPLVRNDKIVCPTCRRQLNKSELYPNNMLKREVLSLQVRCSETENGCRWIGELRQQEEHLANCSLMSEICENDCGVTVRRKCMKKHKEELCLRRIVVCTYCPSHIEYCLLSTHLEECDQYPVECINQCGAVVARGEMDVHTSLEGTCTKSYLPCEFEHAGCRFKGKKRQMELHLAHNSVSHLSMVSKSFHSRLEIAENKLMLAAEQQASTDQKLQLSEKKLTAAEGNLRQTEARQIETEQKLTEARRELDRMNSLVAAVRSQSLSTDKGIVMANVAVASEDRIKSGGSEIRLAHKSPSVTTSASYDFESAKSLKSLLHGCTEASYEASGTFYYVWNIKNWHRELINAKRSNLSVSTSFYTSRSGYHFRLEVFPNGCHQYRGSHLSLGVCQEDGENDFTLPRSRRCSMSLSLCCQRGKVRSKTVCHSTAISPHRKGRQFIAADLISHEEMISGSFLVDNEIFIVFQFSILP